jgi:fatty-acid desaturase
METLGWFILFWFWGSLGITLGYHRALTHKSVKLSKPVLYLLVLGAYFSMSGPPIPWIAVHRFHHQFSDQIMDPHSPVRHGFWRSFLAWMWARDSWSSPGLISIEKYAGDLLDDRFLCMFGTDRFPSNPWRNLICCILLRVILYMINPAIGIASFIAWWVVFFSPHLINSICHMNFGDAPYDTGDNSRNVPWLAPLTQGEAWHCNHHQFPGRAFHGDPEQGQFDMTWEVIKVLNKLNLLTDIRTK